MAKHKNHKTLIRLGFAKLGGSIWGVCELVRYKKYYKVTHFYVLEIETNNLFIGGLG